MKIKELNEYKNVDIWNSWINLVEKRVKYIKIIFNSFLFSFTIEKIEGYNRKNWI